MSTVKCEWSLCKHNYKGSCMGKNVVDLRHVEGFDENDNYVDMLRCNAYEKGIYLESENEY